MSETRRPRPSRGVMGYVAELQQFDPVPPSVYELSPPEPATENLPVTAPPPPVPALPSAPAVTVVSHIRQQRQRRIRAAVLTGAALAIVAGAGVGYAALGRSSDSPRAQAPATGAWGWPTDGPLQLDAAVPSADPVTGGTASPAAGATTTTGGAAGTGLAGPVPVAAPGSTTYPVRPGRPGAVQPPYAAPGGTEAPETTVPVTQAPAPPRPLTATFTHVVDTTDDGFIRYAGTVHIDNPGGTDAAGWRVTLTVPGGNAVDGSGVSVAQDGESVTFTPDGDAKLTAGGSVTFSFSVQGLLPALPVGCAIDGNACR